MTLRRRPSCKAAFAAVLLAASLCFVIPALAQSPALSSDPAADEAAHAALESFQLPSNGALLNAFVYVAAGASPHPTVLLLHGFPGNEKNLDIAQTLRRAGYNVLYFDYRGSWGSPGDFSFTHSIEDTEAAITYLRTPANATKLRVDPNALILAGHSMGGMISAVTAAHFATDPGIRAVVLISAANMTGRVLPAVQSGHGDQALAPVSKALASQGMAPLAGCTPETLAQELIANAVAWDIPSLAPKLTARPLLIVSSDDGNTPAAEALAANLKKLGDTTVTSTHLPTDHSYSDHRIALQQAILSFLATLSTK
ncbi:MAG: alpha/beta hydrolase [Acidobacteriaceae bacterium]|nr:alpha/beta hydrolase [Acidobacteriaceae bacterium]